MSKLKISKASTPSRLFSNDERHIKNKVRQLRFEDKRFENNSAAVRHYVHLGVITEKRTETANTLDDRIIKSSQKEVVRSELIPLVEHINELTKEITFLREQQEVFLAQMSKNFENLRARFETLFEQFSGQFGKLFAELLRTGKINEEALRNAIVLRTIMFVFLIGYKTGRIDPKIQTDWNSVVAWTIKKAAELSAEQIMQIADETHENRLVQDISNELWEVIAKVNKSD